MNGKFRHFVKFYDLKRSNKQNQEQVGIYTLLFFFIFSEMFHIADCQRLQRRRQRNWLLVLQSIEWYLR